MKLFILFDIYIDKMPTRIELITGIRNLINNHNIKIANLAIMKKNDLEKIAADDFIFIRRMIAEKISKPTPETKPKEPKKPKSKEPKTEPKKPIETEPKISVIKPIPSIDAIKMDTLTYLYKKIKEEKITETNPKIKNADWSPGFIKYDDFKKHFKDIMPQKDYQKILSEINRGIGFRYSRNYEIPQTKINETYITFKFDDIIFTITYQESTPFSRFIYTILF
jgi:hypothetical protein